MTKQPTILLVDDNLANLFILEQILAKLPVTLVKACSGQAALSICLKQPIHCLLADVHMPGMDGFELIKTLKRHPLTQPIPVILVTAKIFSENDALKGYQYGAIDYLCRPLAEVIIHRKIDFILQQQQINTQLTALQNQLYDLKQQAIDPLTQLAEQHQQPLKPVIDYLTHLQQR